MGFSTTLEIRLDFRLLDSDADPEPTPHGDIQIRIQYKYAMTQNLMSLWTFFCRNIEKHK